MRIIMPCLAILMLTQPAIAERCDIEPFLLGDGTLLPMPGMRDGQLVFEDAAICRALTALVPQRIAQSTFWLHEIRGVAPSDVVPLGGGLLAPRSVMGCQSLMAESTVLFEHGRVFLVDINEAAADHTWRLPLATGGHQSSATVRSQMPKGCWATYVQAVERVVFEHASTTLDWLGDAAYLADDCIGDDFRWALRGLLNRTLFTRAEAMPMWAPFGACFLRGVRLFDDRVVLGIDCAGRPEAAVVALRPHLVEAFVGANQGMIADATIHPMDETCLTAWDTWRILTPTAKSAH